MGSAALAVPMKNPRGDRGPVGDAVLLVVVAVVAEIPAADVDRGGRGIVKLDRIHKRRIGVRQYFVDDDAAHRAATPGPRRAAELAAAAPVVRVGCVAQGIDDFQG